MNKNQSKKEENFINFNFENIKDEGKSNKNRKKIKSPYVKKNISKEKSKIDKNIFNTKEVSKENNKIKRDLPKSEKNQINNIQNNKESKEKNIQPEKPSYNLSQMSTKNFNETLFDYKQYSLMNNNPIKKKAEFEKELKKTKKLKDISMKKKKKLWIKRDLLDKEQKNNETKEEKKIYLSKQNQKSKIINLNIINEESTNKKTNQGLVLGNKYKGKNDDDDETDLSSDLINNNKIYKRSQDDFDIDLANKNIDSDLFIGKYKQYLKNKNSKKNKDMKKLKHNYDFGNNFDFFNGNII